MQCHALKHPNGNADVASTCLFQVLMVPGAAAEAVTVHGDTESRGGGEPTPLIPSLLRVTSCDARLTVFVLSCIHSTGYSS